VTYDNLNRLTKASQPWTTGTADTLYSYDIEDHLSQVTDAEGNVTTYATSDRDLMTQQVSPVSGTTTYLYNEHGQLKSQTDARGVVTARTLDALDRATQATFSDGTPAVIYTYDAPCAFGAGRLCSIAEGGTSVAYGYDRFGRVIQDGSLAYGYDANGNCAQIGYPGGLTAAYTFDFADRQATLSYDAGAGSAPGVTSASDRSAGPLSSLTLGNGLTESHAFDARYFPVSIVVTEKVNWTYTVDGVGNPTSINDGTTNRVYAYVDQLYFLRQGDGPWGARSWTYDRIGNRLTESRGTTTDTYGYPSGHNPRLTSIALGAGGTKRFVYDPAGNELQESGPTNQVDLSYDGANRLIRMAEETTRSSTSLTYDGRNFLVQARQDVNSCSPVATQSTYSSGGVLLRRSTSNLLTGGLSTDTKILYFAGRPIALVETTTTPATATYLSVDHLGTPILEATAAGASLWTGGFEPFGKDWSGAQAAGEFLRFPGQWEDASWSAASGAGFEYNTRRWYNAQSGRYAEADPIGLGGGTHLYLYALGDPLRWADRLGLRVFRCCAPADIAFGLLNHCWLKTDTREAGLGNLDEGQPAGEAIPGGRYNCLYLAQTQIVNHAGASKTRPGASCEEIKDVDEQCVDRNLVTDARGYGATQGSFTLTNNCQTWANGVLSKCQSKKCSKRPADPPSDSGKRYF
jgi:RHS repeat-associated protein